MYLYARLAPCFTVEAVPGITSLTAAMARVGLPLAARNEVVIVLPGALPDTDLEARMAIAQTVAVPKLGRHAGRVRDLALRNGGLNRLVYISHATLRSEHSCRLAEAPDKAPYFSLALICKEPDPWL